MIGSAARVMLDEFIAEHREDIIRRVADLAVEVGAPLSTEDLGTLNGCLDNASATFADGSERRRSTLDVGVLRDNERLGFFVHELRNFIQTAMVAFEVVKSENGGVGGSTGALLYRSLVGARDLIAGSLTDVRLTQGVQNRERFLASAFIEELVPAAELTANAKGLTFVVKPVNDGLAIEADRHVLAAVVINLLQNAFKFTRPGTTVTLGVGANADRIFIEVQDECGGLPGGDLSGLFRPFEQRGADRTGFGLGLAFSRWATDAINGRIHTRDLPGVGCVFTVDLPRSPVPALEIDIT